MDAPTIRYTKTSDGVSIAYYAIGAGSHYVWPTSFLGSIADNWRMPELRRLLEVVASRTLFVSYDPRGVGLSDRDPTDFSCDAMVHDLEAVVEAAGIERFTLQVWGYMSMPALAYAARHPERVMALVLLNGIMRGADMSASWQALVRLAGEDWEHAKRLLAQSNEAGYAFTATLGEIRKILDRTVSQDAFMAHFEAVDRWDVSELVGRVATPALVAHYGDLAPNYPLEASRRLAASLPEGAFASVEPEGHTVVEVADTIVRSFLRGVLPPEARRGSPRPMAAAPSGTAIILFADIADSTALTERLGDAAFREKARALDEALRRAITSNGGTAIDGKLLGDGVLATFGAAREAIACARACHAAATDGGLALHVGIHAGDVIREEGNVYGGAVNIAARVASEAAAGETLVSQTVRELARTSAGVSFEDRGERELKGVGEPVRVFAVRAA